MWGGYKASRYISKDFRSSSPFQAIAFKTLPNVNTSSVCFLHLHCGTRGKSQPRVNCCSKTRLPSLSRTVASCLEPRNDASSCLSSWSSSVSQLTGRKASCSLDTLLKTVSRWVPTQRRQQGCIIRIKHQKQMFPGYELHNTNS